jgi:hypothetical protein
MEIAIQDDYVLGGGGRLDVATAYKLAHEMGTTVVRVNVLSSEVAGKGFGRLDTLIDRIRAEGMIPQVTIMGRPKWYVANQPDGGCPHIDPHPAKFAQFCTKVVSHFGDKVWRYSIWNEPNHPTFLQCTTGPSYKLYAQLYQVGFNTIRALNPKAIVLWGEIAGGANSKTWVVDALKEGVRLNKGKPVSTSGIAIHPYQYMIEPLKESTDDAIRFGDLTKFKSWLATTEFVKNSIGHPAPLYITEFGWFNPPHKLSIPDKTRAEWATKAVRHAKNMGVSQFLYFTLTESPNHEGNWDTGIVKMDGTPSLTYQAIKKAVTWT